MSTRDPGRFVPDITVPVPDDRVAEFFKWYGQWLEGSPPATPSAPLVRQVSPSSVETLEPQHNRSLQPWTDTEEDLALAKDLWRKLSAPAQAMIDFLAADPGQRFSGAEIADAVGIPHGAAGVAGTLTWPSRHGVSMGRSLPTSWDEYECKYWLEPEVASLFHKVRGD